MKARDFDALKTLIERTAIYIFLLLINCVAWLCIYELFKHFFPLRVGQ